MWAVVSSPVWGNSLYPTEPTVVLATVWLAVEVIFWVIFHWKLVPIANECRPPAPYRAPYQVDKHVLLRRIVHRICNDCLGGDMNQPAQQDAKHEDWVTLFAPARDVFAAYLTSWFRAVPTPPRSGSVPAPVRSRSDTKKPNYASMPSASESDACSVCSSTTSGDEDVATVATKLPLQSTTTTSAASTTSAWTIPGLYRAEMDDFLAWALFAKETSDMDEAERWELQTCHDELSSTLALTIPHQDAHTVSATKFKLVPRRFSLEEARPWHRPLAVYLVVHVLRTMVVGGILRCCGFRRAVASTGLQGWIRTPRNNTAQSTPLVFFHGIAPAGLLFYLPMVLVGLPTSNRTCILVENPNISCTLSFRALSPHDTVRGVEELLAQARASTTPCHDTDPTKTSTTPPPLDHVTVCGHSFGSCPISWLLHDATFRPRIRHVVLMDPVTVLLSDPAVMMNFLYSREVSNIRVIASSELFTEYYLRRHFSWYNSELWLDETLSPATPPPTVSHANPTRIDHATAADNYHPLHVIVALSERDEIVNAPNVKRHVDLCAERLPDARHLKTVYWKGAKHASCVTDPRKWRDLRTAMLQSEVDVLDSS